LTAVSNPPHTTALVVFLLHSGFVVVAAPTDPEDAPPMEFQLGALPHFKTEDQSKHGEFVRVLGLGGSTFYDWSSDSRRPMLKGCETDYVTFDGKLFSEV
jgi:hypothetical protein